MIYIENNTAVQEVSIPRSFGVIVPSRPQYVTEAPKDNKEYVRKNGSWTQNSASIDAYTKAETNSLLANKANVGASYTKAEENTLLANKANIGASYTKSEEDTLLAGKANVGASYTKGEEESLLAEKQDTISDLATIRQNAQMGVSALHHDDETANILGIWSFDGTIAVQTPTEDYEATNKEYVDTALSAKADASTTYTKTEVDTAIAGHHDSTKANVGASYTKAEDNALLAGKVSEPTTEGTAGQVLATNGAGGRYWTTAGGGGGGIPEAPVDGNTYGRKNSAWQRVYSKSEMDSTIGSLEQQIDSKAEDSDVLHKAGDETANGAKTFNDGVFTTALFLSTENDGATFAGENVDEDNLKIWVTGAGRYANFEVGRDPISEMETATKQYVDTGLASKANASTTYSKTEVDTAIANHHDSTKANTGVSYTKAEDDALLATKANASTTYSKTEVDTAIAGHHDSAKVNEPASEGTSGQVLTTDGAGGRTWTTVGGGGQGGFILVEAYVADPATVVGYIQQNKMVVAYIYDEDEQDYQYYVYTGKNCWDSSRYTFSYISSNSDYGGVLTIGQLVLDLDNGWDSGNVAMLPSRSAPYNNRSNGSLTIYTGGTYVYSGMTSAKTITLHSQSDAETYPISAIVVQSGTAYQFTWTPSSGTVLWGGGGSAPTMQANKTYEFSFLYLGSTVNKWLANYIEY